MTTVMPSGEVCSIASMARQPSSSVTCEEEEEGAPY